MNVAFCLKVSFCLALVKTFGIQMTAATVTQTTFTDKVTAQNQSTVVSELRHLDQKLEKSLLKLEKVCNSLKFLKHMSLRFTKQINGISDWNKVTSIELHNIPSLNFDEQYDLVKYLSKQMFGKFDDREIAGIRVFFTHMNIKSRKLIIQFSSMHTKFKWFHRFIEISKQKGFTHLKHFPGFNISLYDGTPIRGVTIHDHISRFKAAILKVAQATLSKYKYMKVFINNTEIYVDRKIGTNTFVRYLLQDFDDVRNVKELLLRESVPLAFKDWARQDITFDHRYKFTKNQYMSTVSLTFPNRVHLHLRTTPKKIFYHYLKRSREI